MTGMWHRTQGSSMEPALPGGSAVEIVPMDGRQPRPGDAVLARLPDGSLVLHRVRRVSGGRLVLRGDGARRDDPSVAPSALLGWAPSVPRATLRTRLAHWAAPVLAELGTPTMPGLEARVAGRYREEPPAASAEGLEPWEEDFASRLPAGAAVLDIGCGAGREARALEALGFSVSGLDPSPGPGFLRASAFDLLDPSVLPGPFGGALFTRGLHSLLPLRRRRVALLRAVARRLVPGGLLALAAVEAPPRVGPRRVLVGMVRALLTAARRGHWESGDRMLRYVTGPGIAGPWVFCHVFGPGEVARELGLAGFADPVAAEAGWIARRPAT